MAEKKTGFAVLREALGYSVQEFSSALGISRATEWKWEKGGIPATAQTKIRVQYGLPPTIDLSNVLSDDQETQVYELAFQYLMKEGPAKKRIRRETFFGDLTLPQETSGTKLDHVLSEVRLSFVSGKPSEDARIRIMTEALRLIMDEQEQQ